MHHLQVLLVLRRSARCNLINPSPGLSLRRSAKPYKGGEKLVVPAHTCMGYECSHREAIYQRVIARLIFISIGGRYSTIATHRLWRQGSRSTYIRYKTHLRLIDTQQIARCGIDKALCIDCTRKVHMQIGSLGHTNQKRPQSRWILLRCSEGAFNRAHSNFRLPYSGRGQQKTADQHRGSSHSSSSDQSWGRNLYQHSRIEE